MRTLIPLVTLLVLALTGCMPKKIPGTDLDDTSETRAVIDVMQKYRVAVEAKDTGAILKLTDESFRDDGAEPLGQDEGIRAVSRIRISSARAGGEAT